MPTLIELANSMVKKKKTCKFLEVAATSCQGLLTFQTEDFLFPHLRRRGSVIGDPQPRRVDVVAMIVRINEIDDSDLEHRTGREPSSVAFLPFLRIQGLLKLLVDAMLVHPDRTIRIRAVDQWCVRVPEIVTCAVHWEFL